MKDYFRKLKEHPGIEFATILTFVGFLAGASNKHMDFLSGGIMGALIMGGVCWTIVLLSNINNKG